MKKLISIALVLAMMLAIMPMTVFAADANGFSYKLSSDGTYYIVSDYEGTATEVVIPSEYDGLPVKEIGNGAFSECSYLKKVDIPNSVTTIGMMAFKNCGLNDITIPSSVSTIGWAAFYLCPILDVYCEAESKPEGWDDEWDYTLDIGQTEIHWGISIENGFIFSLSEDKTYYSVCGYVGAPVNLNIPAVYNMLPVKEIRDYTFCFCESLETIFIPASIEMMGTDVLSTRGNLKEICCESKSKPEGWGYWYEDPAAIISVRWGCYIENGIIYELSEDETYWIVSDYSGEITDVVIKSECIGRPVKEIVRRMFYDCDSITSVEIPDSVTTIGDSAFENCTKLASVKIGNSVTTIESSAFKGCSSLTSIDIPNSVTTIESSAFEGCSSLTSIDIPDSAIKIGRSAFSGCDNLTFNVYDNAKYLGNATNRYHALMEVVSSDITSCDIHENTKVIADSAFSNCENLTSIEIPDSVTTIGNSAFFACDSITSIDIPDSVTTIGDNAFFVCDNLTFNVYDNAKYLGNATNGYLALIEKVSGDITSCEIHGNTKIIAGGAFSGCDITSIDIPDSVITIGDYAFGSCRYLTSVDIPDSATFIGYGAFAWCNRLTSITIPDSVTTISDEVFAWCDNLADIYCEAKAQPAGWAYGWNDGCNATVHWGYVIEDEEPELALGDIDGNDEITAADYVFTKRAVMGTYSLTEAQKKAADIDKNGSITAADYVLVKRAVMGTYVLG